MRVTRLKVTGLDR